MIHAKSSTTAMLLVGLVAMSAVSSADGAAALRGEGRRLNARCKASHVTWIEDSSMSVNGDTWHGKVQGGEYHCMVSKNGGGNKYRVDCNKNGGKATDFYFDDGSDKYELLMNHNGQHVVHYKGNPYIRRIGWCN